jgi:RNA polymerase sigma-70 factor, ECF subfamily
MNTNMDATISADLLVKGDQEEFSKLIELYSDPIYRLALNITGNSLDAEDILQETMIKVLRSIHSFQGKSSLYTWIYRIALNESIQVLRKGKNNALSIDEEEDDEIGPPREIRSWDMLPEEQVISGEIKQKLDIAIQKLSEKLKVVFVLRDIQDLSIQETAELLGVSEEVVKTRLLRARLALRETLTQYFGETRLKGTK